MSYQTIQKQISEQSSNAGSKMPMSDFVAIGTVVDTNDPMQLGRVRAVVPAWGDSWEHEVEAMPWCMYVTPFGGHSPMGMRGPGVDETEGSVSYGMWAIPKIGAQVVVMSLDEQRLYRLYIGCVYTQFTTHTMPHGRWISEDHPVLEENGYGNASQETDQLTNAATSAATKYAATAIGGAVAGPMGASLAGMAADKFGNSKDTKKNTQPKPYGPLSSREKPIQPLADNMSKAFGNKSDSYEWRTRVADYAVSRVDVSHLDRVISKVPDDQETVLEDWSSTQGYQNSRLDPKGNPNGKNYDSQTYSWTTPGFHAISMDDRQENCRVRIRTTSGHQIIMDDTNERIYIATAQGNNWIELDQAGNIDIYTSNKVNVRAKQDINFTSDKTIRMYAKEGIHMHSDSEIRTYAKEDIHTITDQTIRTHAKKDIYVQSDKSTHYHVGDKFNLFATADLSIKTGKDLKLQSTTSTHIKAGSNVVVTAGGKMTVNGPPAAAATKASKPNEKSAFYTNRVPAAEPWGRCMTKKDDGHEPELPYNDPNMGKMERGIKIKRGYFWRR